MTRKERVELAITHREPDRVPHQINLTIAAREMLQEHFKTDDLDTALGNHIAMTSPELPVEDIKANYVRDEWGVVWNRTIDKDIGVVEGTVLPEATLDGLTLPDPHDPRRYQGFADFIDAHADQFLICGIGFSLYERAWTLRGLQNFLMDLAVNVEFAEELLDTIVDYNLTLIEEAGRFGFDAFQFGDDWGQQTGVTMGPETWRRLIKPRVARLYAAVHDRAKHVVIHSCGAVQDLFEDLIEVGLEVFNPFQPEVMEPVETKRRFSGRLAFYGGVSTQETLPHASPEGVRAEVRRLLTEVGKGGGYVLAPAHDVQRDVPLENILALLDEVRSQPTAGGAR